MGRTAALSRGYPSCSSRWLACEIDGYGIGASRGRWRGRVVVRRRRGGILPQEDSRRNLQTYARGGEASTSDNKASKVERALNQVVSLTSVPLVTYIPEPATILHGLDARLKQLCIIATLVLCARGSWETRLAASGAIAFFSWLCLPKHYARSQIVRVLQICALVGVSTLLFSDTVGIPVQERLPSSELLGMQGMDFSTDYKYVLLDLKFLKVTRRSVQLACAAASLQFTTVQTAVVSLTTTSPEELASAFAWFLRPLQFVRTNTTELCLSLLLSFRFLGIVFEEFQNLSKSVLARNIRWKDLNLVAKLDVFTTLASKMLENLLSISENIAKSMIARGYHSSCFRFPKLLKAKNKEE